MTVNEQYARLLSAAPSSFQGKARREQMVTAMVIAAKLVSKADMSK